MNPILDMLMNAAGGSATRQVSQRFGLSEEQTSGALNQLVPALLSGLQRNASQPEGLESLLGALTRGSHGQYLDQPELLDSDSTTQDGNSILGHVFGSKDVSRAVASQAAEQTGIGAEVLKKMLPVVATMVMGALSKQNSSGPAGLLETLLSSAGSQDSSSQPSAGDALGMLGRLFGGR